MLFFLKDNKKEFILWLNVPKVTAYSQFVTSNYMSEDEIQAIKMGVRRPPFAFTEQGVSQLSSVLKSDRAIETS